MLDIVAYNDYNILNKTNQGGNKMLDTLKQIASNNEQITDTDLSNIIEMGQHYYRKEELTKQELTSTYKDYCFQYDIEIKTVLKYTFEEVLKQYNYYYNTNVNEFNYKDEEELQDIIVEIFELEENFFIQVDHDNKIIILS